MFTRPGEVQSLNSTIREDGVEPDSSFQVAAPFRWNSPRLKMCDNKGATDPPSGCRAMPPRQRVRDVHCGIAYEKASDSRLEEPLPGGHTRNMTASTGEPPSHRMEGSTPLRHQSREGDIL